LADILDDQEAAKAKSLWLFKTDFFEFSVANDFPDPFILVFAQAEYASFFFSEIWCAGNNLIGIISDCDCHRLIKAR